MPVTRAKETSRNRSFVGKSGPPQAAVYNAAYLPTPVSRGTAHYCSGGVK